MSTAEALEIRFKIDENFTVPEFQDKNRNPFKLTNPPVYAMLLWGVHEGTMIYTLFPDIDPKNPSTKLTKLAIAPNLISIERLLQIYKDFMEIKPDNVIEASLLHLTEEQLSVLALVDFDQNSLFDHIYQEGKSNNDLFEIGALVKVIEDDFDEVRP